LDTKRIILGARLAKDARKDVHNQRRTIMATQPDSTYYWDLGIDWDLVPTIANSTFMPGGFVLRGATDSLGTLQRPVVLPGQKIIFRIFDLKAGVVMKIESFTINPQIAVLDTTNPGSPPNTNINPLDSLQPGLPADSAREESIFFRDSLVGDSLVGDSLVGDGLPCWRSAPVAIKEAASGKFLLNFFVQATRELPDSFILRTFVHDPEMVVGGDGG
jgi:hypothetical protein